MQRFGMLPISAHTRMPWRIHDIAKDFRVEDVWALPTPGGPDDFPRLVDLMSSFDPAASSPVVRALFAIRWRLGDWLGLDRSDSGLDARVPSLRARLPADLRGDVEEVALPADSPFRLLYVAQREAAFEIANNTVHGVLHLGWRPDASGGYRGELAVLVKPNGRYGSAYLAAIAPFRYTLVYPLMLRSIRQRWRQQTVRQVDVPSDIRDLSTLPTIDYADAFLVDTSAHGDWTPERWAIAVLEEAPLETRSQLLAGWSALGLKGAETDRSVLGWDVRRSSADTLLLGRNSRIGMPGELLFARRPDGLIFATFVHHQTAATRAMWAAVQRTHVQTVTSLLARAVNGSYGLGGSGLAGAGGTSGNAGGGGATAGSTGEVGTFGPGA
jgi:Protein of unknown function (DUF2867)